ncbi:MAG: iron-sulfur cluster repair di-iron protein [Fidelibacterota bacterium]
MIENKTIGQIVADNIRTANVFKKYGLDFCCGGEKSIESACTEKGVNIADLMKDIDAVLVQSETVEDFQSMALDTLIEHIYNQHHKYIYELGPITAEFINKVARVHGENHPETIEIAKLYNGLLAELHQHMMKEEQILFPAIKRMVSDQAAFSSFVNGPISVMKMEHDNAGDILKRMNLLSSGYTLPEDACNTYRAAYTNLNELEENIHVHIHLENNILFPKAISLEEQLLNS